MPDANAADFKFIDSKPISEFWLNAGFISHHFQTDKGLNNNNYGIGGEYRYSTTNSITAGEFYNSDRQTSHYVGWYWQPVSYGPLRLGAVAGGFDGYPKMRNGGWFLAAIPMVSVEYKSVGMNLAIVPTYQNRLYGALSFQFKVKLP
ncbi:MAG: hypothetical protein WCD45_06010 [Gallionella sp.]